MSEIKKSKLHHVIRVAWESEQMPGWEDSLSVILGATMKEFQVKSKDTGEKEVDPMYLKQEEPVL